MFCVYLVYKFYNRWHNTSFIFFYILGEVGANLLYLTDHLKDINGNATEHSRRMNPVQVRIGNNSSINFGDTFERKRKPLKLCRLR
ncbi:unnamed protein product [Callosobruchus maculatus]|uniref:Uncharacterized protein n=1 Tax=Callosobruchus maculatus TaxID=64391 RepID=A0A653BKX5_CALMS|nr:unnamed protein product [Callosobruchus maculatus]VEN36238.1 unnamed protein product [Callosobruchus maculatus]